MSIPCPPISWPSVLEETGPAEDPTITLSGMARVGSTPLQIVAIRIEPRLRFMPDYKSDVDSATYNHAQLEVLLEELGNIAETDAPEVVELSSGRYVMWIGPLPGRSG